MTDQFKNLLILNALMVKAQGSTVAPNIDVTFPGQLIVEPGFTIYITPDWETIQTALVDLDVALSVFSSEGGMKASVTKDVDGTVMRLVFPVPQDGREAAIILNRILELYVRVQTWTLNPRDTIPGWGKQYDELFGWID